MKYPTPLLKTVGPMRRVMINRHGKHEGQAGVEGQQGGSASGFTHVGAGDDSGGAIGKRAATQIQDFLDEAGLPLEFADRFGIIDALEKAKESGSIEDASALVDTTEKMMRNIGSPGMPTTLRMIDDDMKEVWDEVDEYHKERWFNDPDAIRDENGGWHPIEDNLFLLETGTEADQREFQHRMATIMKDVSEVTGDRPQGVTFQDHIGDEMKQALEDQGVPLDNVGGGYNPNDLAIEFNMEKYDSSMSTEQEFDYWQTVYHEQVHLVDDVNAGREGFFPHGDNFSVADTLPLPGWYDEILIEKASDTYPTPSLRGLEYYADLVAGVHLNRTFGRRMGYKPFDDADEANLQSWVESVRKGEHNSLAPEIVDAVRERSLPMLGKFKMVPGDRGDGEWEIVAIPIGETVERHGEHVGQEGVKGQQGGSAKGYSHKGGAAKGEKRKGGRGISAGITPAREGKSESLVSAQAEKLGERFSAIDGVTVNEFGDGTGAWEGGSESTIILNYEGNGEALEALQDRARAWNQDSVMVYGDDLEVGQDGSVATWTLNGPIKSGDRKVAEQALTLAGGGGWTWQGTAQNPVLAFVQTPEFDTSPQQYASIVGKMNEHFGDLATVLDRQTKVAVGWKDGDYEWH